jgi:cell division protein FtsQ
MTTLHVREGALREAVSAFPDVRTIRVHTDFPHGLRIEVIENLPVAALEANGRRVAVAEDGSVLRGRPLDGLPVVPAHQVPSGTRVIDRQALGAIAAAGAAPAAFRPLIVRIRSGGSDGLRVDLQGGMRLIFGSRTHLATKWTAALRVLSDPKAAGATYLDLRIPERPVAGGNFAEALPTVHTQPSQQQSQPAQDAAPGDGQPAASTDPSATDQATQDPAQQPTTTDESAGNGVG